MVPSPELLLSKIFAGNTSSRCTERRKTKRENDPISLSGGGGDGRVKQQKV
jgi:hypothetical protein